MKDDSPVIRKMRYAERNTRPPTLKHRPVLTFGILGTVYGISPEGEVKYFDYDWDGALEFAGVTAENWDDLDMRYSRPKRNIYLPGHDMWNPERCVKTTERAWWALKEEQ